MRSIRKILGSILIFVCLFLVILYAIYPRIARRRNTSHIQLINPHLLKRRIPEPVPGPLCFLGEKAINDNTPDKNGMDLSLPVWIIGTYKDSLNALKDQQKLLLEYKSIILRTGDYNFQEKNKEFALIVTEVKDNDTILPKFGYRKYISKIRKGNFDQHDLVTKDNVSFLYRYYDVTPYNDSLYLVSPKKVYSHARFFNRLILFDANGRQKSAKTFYDNDIAKIISLPSGYLIGLNNSIYNSAYWCTDTYSVMKLDASLNIVWEKESPKKGLSSFIEDMEIQNNRIYIKVGVAESCGACMDSWWKYAEYRDMAGKITALKIVEQHSFSPKVSADSLIAMESPNYKGKYYQHE